MKDFYLFIINDNRLSIILYVSLISLLLLCLLGYGVSKSLNSFIPTREFKDGSDELKGLSDSFFYKNKDEVNSIKNVIRNFISLTFFFLVLALIFSLYKSNSLNSSNSSDIEFGPFGDLFNGSLAPILAFASFIFILITLVMQSIQMRATLHELNLSRNEMKESNLALKSQARNVNLQTFNNNLFSLIDNYKNLIKELKERNFLNEESKKIQVPYEDYIFKKINRYWLDDKDLINYWESVSDDFLGIFLINYQILKYTFENNSNKEMGEEPLDNIQPSEDAKRYASVLRAITPKNITFLIYINCALNDYQKYRELLEGSSFFEHLYFDKFDLKLFKKISSKYDLRAFGDKKKINEYLIFEINALQFMFNPVLDFSSYCHEFDMRKFNGKDEEKAEFQNLINLKKKEIYNFYKKNIIDEKQKCINIALSENELFKKFCNDDITYYSEYSLGINNLIIESKKNIDSFYK